MGSVVLKSVATAALAAVLMIASAPAPARAQDIFAGFVVARVCLPYASRAKTFEGAIRAARDMDFRRPAGSREALDDWQTAVELVSRDGRWRLHIEEGTVTENGVDVYSVWCGISSNQTSARELGQVARLIVRGNLLWTQPEGQPWRWDRRTPHPDEYAIRIDVTEEPGQRAMLAARGSYF